MDLDWVKEQRDNRMSDEIEKWAMPEWMEKYRDAVDYNGIEDLMTKLKTDITLYKNDIATYITAGRVEAKVNLLTRLKEEGIIE